MPPAWRKSRGEQEFPKGTLYVYFASKKDMFEVILEDHFQERDSQIFALSDSDENIEGVLTRLGGAFVL
jgi:AcrR family transcriptional regulator